MNLSHKVAPGDLYAVAPAMMIACGLAARGFD
jgi:Tfp pilus assembly PilM family ATPase